MTQDQTIKDRTFDLLHFPGRKDNLGDIYDHLNAAARLSRALWTALNNSDLDLADERDREAMIELASIVADRTSAAEAAFYKKELDESDAANKSKDAMQ
jgi:hypothetical protein